VTRRMVMSYGRPQPYHWSLKSSGTPMMILPNRKLLDFFQIFTLCIDDLLPKVVNSWNPHRRFLCFQQNLVSWKAKNHWNLIKA
jgi:hypothetical protein